MAQNKDNTPSKPTTRSNMSIESLKTFFDVGTVILLFLTFAFGAGVLITGNIINKQQEERLREFNKKLAEAQTNLGQQQERAAKAEKDLLELQVKVAPRRLTSEQRLELVRLLSHDPGNVYVVSAMQDAESSDFADDLDVALKEAHWQTARMPNRSTRARGVSVGTVVGTRLGDTKRLSDALIAIGVSNSVVSFSKDDHSTSPWFEPNSLYLVVDHKPEPAAKP